MSLFYKISISIYFLALSVVSVLLFNKVKKINDLRDKVAGLKALLETLRRSEKLKDARESYYDSVEKLEEYLSKRGKTGFSLGGADIKLSMGPSNDFSGEPFPPDKDPDDSGTIH